MPATPNIIPLHAHPRARQGESGAALDVVAQAFDHLARDTALPGAVRAELARLRVPALRLAQVSPDFFANGAHPARRLIDAIGATSLGLDDAVAEGDASVHAIATAVRAVLSDFDADPAPFDAAVSFLEDYLAERTRAEDDAARVLVQAIVQRETADLPRRAAAEEVSRRLASRVWVPTVVRAMLAGPWVQALARACREHGEGSAAWHGLVRTMDDLLWSVEPKTSPEGRRRLAAMLPELVDALDTGLDRAQVPEAERDAFLSALVDCHQQAMKAGLRGLMLVADREASTPAPAPQLTSTTFDAGPRRVESIELENAPEASPDIADGAVARLRVGAWIELERGARVPARKRLAWSSPLTGAFLFVGLAPDSIGIAITPAALAEKLRRNGARVLDATPLVERTLGALVQRLAPQG